MEQALVDLALNPSFVHALMERIYEISATITRRFLESPAPISLLCALPTTWRHSRRFSCRRRPIAP